MRKIDRTFLTLFKDLKIVEDKTKTRKDGKPALLCYIGKESISARDVVALVQRYQEEIVKMLTEQE